MRAANHSDILVIGGGVAGLAAATALARHGQQVTLLEARDRCGGRIFTARPRGWRAPLELGAEFVHGGNPALWQALRRHHIGSRNVPTQHWRFDGHTIVPIEDVTDQIERVTKHIQPRKMAGWSFAEFMRRCGSQFTPEDRELALGFVEGFEAAPTTRMSASAVAGESLDTSEQYHVPRGYDQLVAGLVREARQAKVALVLRSPVSEIRWQRGNVTVTAARRKFTARAVVLAIPLGVLQARRGQRGAITFVPPVRAKMKILARLQMGHVIRLTLRIDPAKWASVVPPALQRARGGFGFIHSRVEGVPVWWALSGSPVLTGWAGGPDALALAGRSRCGVFERALSSLSRVFGVKKIALRRAVVDFATHNWSRDPYSRGAYSFAAAGAETAAEKFREPVQGTLFFAGEATADGAEIGTVHGALTSGLRAAKEAIMALKQKA